MATDPFASPAGSADQSDPFGQPATGGGKFPKAPDLNGALLLITPIKVDLVPKYQSKTGEMTERLSADTAVIQGGGDYEGQSFDAMYWSQSPIVAAGQKALRQHTKMILGRLRRVPTKDTRSEHKVETWQEFEDLADSWDYKRNKLPSFAWVLEPFDEGDAVLAREWIAKNAPSPF
jgi:hypothetical protein